MSATARLNLPYIAPLQAQKQVSYNEAMAALDQLVQPVVKSRSLATPPASPTEGDTYLVAPAPGGAWAGRAHHFATWRDGGWSFRAPAPGWLAYVVDTDEIAIAQPAGDWASLVTTGGAALVKLGINTSADLSSRLAVAADGTLLTHDGADHRLTLNKAAAADTASLVFATGYAGRAELGIAGDDALHVKLSADGVTWSEALRLAADGTVRLPQGHLVFPAAANPSADAHTLDDYDEGTWTPGLNFNNAGTGITYGSPTLGRYTKIGRTVHAKGSVVLTSKGSATGAATITGLPFANANDGLYVAASVGFTSNLSGLTGAVIGVVAPGSTRINLYASTNGAAATLSNANFSATTQIYVAVSYDV